MADYGPNTVTDDINKLSPMMTPWTTDFTNYRAKYTLTTDGEATFQIYSSLFKKRKIEVSLNNETRTFYTYIDGKHRTMVATDSTPDISATVTVEADEADYYFGFRIGLLVWKSSTTEWIDYTKKLLKLEFKAVKNGNYTLYATLCQIDNTDTLLVKGNVVALYAGNTLLHKFVLKEPMYYGQHRKLNLANICELEGLTSTGNKTSQYELRKMFTEDESYTDEEIKLLLINLTTVDRSNSTTLAEDLDAVETGVDVTDGSKFSQFDYVRVDDEIMYVQSISSNTLTVLRGQHNSTATTHINTSPIYGVDLICDNICTLTDKISIDFPYDDKIKSVKKICDESGNVFYWTYPNLGVASTGDDTLNVATTQGSQKALTLRTSGLGLNCSEVKKEDVDEALYNDVILVGKVSGLEQLRTRNFHATLKRTFTDGKVDTYLAEDLDTSETGVDVKDGGNFSNNDYIKIDSEVMKITAGGGTNTFTVTRAQGGTSASAHKNGADVLQWGDGTDLINGGNFTLTVDDTTDFDSSGNLYIGSEVMTYSDKPSGTTFTVTDRAQNDAKGDSTIAYTHGDNIEVYDSQYYHTVGNSQTGSSIKLYGQRIKKFTDHNAKTKNELDLHAQNYRAVYDWIDADGNEDKILQIYAYPAQEIEFLDAEGIFIGDSIHLYDSSTGLTDTSTWYEIVGLDYLWDMGFQELKVNFSNRPFDYSRTFKEELSIDYAQPTRALSEEMGEYSRWDGSNYSIITPSGDIIIDGERTYIYGNSWLGLDVDAGTLDISNDSGDIQVYAVGGKVSLGSDNLMEFGEFKLDSGDSAFWYSNSDYLEIYHSGTNSIVRSHTTPMELWADGAIKFRDMNYVLTAEHFDVERDANGINLIEYDGRIALKTDGDTDDFIYFETTSNVPAIKTSGGCILEVIPDGLSTDFYKILKIKDVSSGQAAEMFVVTGTGNLLIEAISGDIQMQSNVIPGTVGTLNLGDSTTYWNEIHYKTLTDEGCLGGCSYLESATDAICNLEILPEVKTDDFGDSRLDYSTFPKELQMGSGVNVSGVISMLLKSIKELNDRIEKLENT